MKLTTLTAAFAAMLLFAQSAQARLGLILSIGPLRTVMQVAAFTRPKVGIVAMDPAQPLGVDGR